MHRVVSLPEPVPLETSCGWAVLGGGGFRCGVMRSTHRPPWEWGVESKRTRCEHLCSGQEAHLDRATSLPGSGSPGLLLVRASSIIHQGQSSEQKKGRECHSQWL